MPPSPLLYGFSNQTHFTWFFPFNVYGCFKIITINLSISESSPMDFQDINKSCGVMVSEEILGSRSCGLKFNITPNYRQQFITLH